MFSLIQLGSRIGAFQTLLYVFATFLLGLTILRAQGMEIIGKLREVQMGGFLPQRLLVDDLAVGLAGLLLMIPGLVTDTMAAVVLIGPLWRRLLTSLGASRQAKSGFDGAPPRGGPFSSDSDAFDADKPRSAANDPIEGEFRRLDDD